MSKMIEISHSNFGCIQTFHKKLFAGNFLSTLLAWWVWEYEVECEMLFYVMFALWSEFKVSWESWVREEKEDKKMIYYWDIGLKFSLV